MLEGRNGPRKDPITKGISDHHQAPSRHLALEGRLGAPPKDKPTSWHIRTQLCEARRQARNSPSMCEHASRSFAPFAQSHARNLCGTNVRRLVVAERRSTFFKAHPPSPISYSFSLRALTYLQVGENGERLLREATF